MSAVLYVFSITLFLMICHLLYIRWNARNKTKWFYKSILDLYSKARARGLDPKSSCLDAIENLYPRVENVKTKMATVNRINSDLARAELAQDEKHIVSELVRVASIIQSQLKLEKSDEKRNEILEECLKKFDLFQKQHKVNLRETTFSG